jgi:hypothetical protein
LGPVNREPPADSPDPPPGSAVLAPGQFRATVRKAASRAMSMRE